VNDNEKWKLMKRMCVVSVKTKLLRGEWGVDKKKRVVFKDDMKWKIDDVGWMDVWSNERESEMMIKVDGKNDEDSD